MLVLHRNMNLEIRGIAIILYGKKYPSIVYFNKFLKVKLSLSHNITKKK